MSPETWAGWAGIASAVAASIAGSWRVGGVVAERMRARSGGNGPGAITATLTRIEREVSDRDGSVRSAKHDLAQHLQAMVGHLGLMRASQERAEAHLAKVLETLVEIRIEAAERGNCCEHCK